MRALIIEKNIGQAEFLHDLLKKELQHFEAMRFSEVFSLLPLVRAYKPDVLFIDIELKGKSGFDLVSELPELPCSIVYTASSADYAIQAFRNRADHYLVRPYQPGDIRDLLRTMPGQHTG